MRILTLIKYTIDVAEIKVNPASKELLTAGAPAKMGNIDKNVVEAAVRLKESNGGSVVGLCFGPHAALDSFKDVLAMGLDEITLVEDAFAGSEECPAVVSILEAAIRKLGAFDLIMAGFASDDGYTYQIAPRLAERLDLPLVSYASQLTVIENTLQADRKLEDYLQTVSVTLPALVSIAEEAFPPRRTTLMDAIKAKKKPVQTWQVETDLGLTQAMLSDNNFLVSASQMGVVVQRKQQMFKNQPAVELVDQLIDALIEENVLKGNA